MPRQGTRSKAVLQVAGWLGVAGAGRTDAKGSGRGNGRMASVVIAIKDFEMPNGCRDCRFSNKDFYMRRICLAGGILIDGCYYFQIRHESCPLVEITDHVG